MKIETQDQFMEAASRVDPRQRKTLFQIWGSLFPKEWMEEAHEKFPPGIGLGDIVASVATPIARALGADCIDKETNDLKPKSPCQKRKDELNKIRI